MRRILSIFLMPILCMVIILGCQSNESLDPEISSEEQSDVGNQIMKNLDIIINNKEIQASSNPNDYIKANQKLYENIVITGDKGLEFLVHELRNSKDDGLKEWIMAKTCEDIINQKMNGWSTGKEWLAKYEELKK
ncbi:hypothetical protein [Paenibacillus macerans]|uniref:hypothetical protein n=1 Tax=Paenibacillus macerans TaxID=44252 RepID=UPI003D31001A